MPKLSLSMIVKNEEQNLRNCLESVRGVVDEIVIVDTGSSDNTIEIAEQYHAKIYHFDWCNDFSAARNYALSKSRGDWVLYLDADERLKEKSKNEIINLIDNNEKLGINCFVNSISSNGRNSQIMKYTRLFRNDPQIKFDGKAHEQIEPSLRSNRYEIIDSKIEIIHLGYDVSEPELKSKAERNLNLLLDDYKKKKLPYLAYQIANSYAVLKMEDEKARFYSEALKGNSLNKELRSICFLELADYELRKGNINRAKEYVDNGIKENDNHVLIKMIATQVYGKLKEFDKAILICEDALNKDLNTKGDNKNFSLQEINLSKEKILFQGMLLSLISENNNKFKYFSSLLIDCDELMAKIFFKIFENKRLNESEISELVNIVSLNNLELVLTLLSRYQFENKIKFLRLGYGKFHKNPNFISYYAKNLISLNHLSEAQQVLESAVTNLIFELPIIMYLASIYIRTNQLERLNNLLENLEAESKSNHMLASNLLSLKNKLIPILNKIAP